MRNLPKLPKKVNGSYDAVSLLQYFEKCGEQGIPHHVIASHLRVPQHRVTYMLNSGYQQVKKRAGKEIAQQRNRVFIKLTDEELENFLLFKAHGIGTSDAARAALKETFIKERKSL